MLENTKRFQPNELHPELLGVLGLSPFEANNSASRSQMYSSHVAQALVINGSTERHIQTGMEREYGKYTFSVAMPCDAEIIRVIERYPRTIDGSSISHNPETLVIYEDVETKVVGCLSLVDYFSHHQYFGFAYKRRPAVSKLRAGEFIAAGTILLDSPSVTENGGYKYGRECNVAFMSHPAVSEDGIVISRDVLKEFSFKTYETRVVEWGGKNYPLNLYGTENDYKPHPDIGDLIRDDGILMALRSYDESFSPVEQSVRKTMEVDHVFDNCTYAGGPGGRIIDIRVMHDPESSVPSTPVGMDVQSQRYDDARRRYYQEVYNVYQRLKRTRAGKLSLSHDFQRLVVEALSVVGPAKKAEGDNQERVTKLRRGVPLDDWWIEFVIEYDVVPTIGFKLTDCHGGKGVICHIAEPHEMPVDAAGNRADVLMDPGARISRSNLGGLYEPYINASSRDLVKELRVMLDLPNPIPMGYKFTIAQHPRFEAAWGRFLRFIEIVTPHTYHAMTAPDFTADRAEYLAHILLRPVIDLHYPSNNQRETRDLVELLEAEYPSTYGPVTYTGYSGVQCTTKQNVRIGSMYIMLLEKTGDDWTAVSSGKLQNFGVLAQITNRDKFTQPTRNQAIRAFGETEVRIMTAYAGPLLTAEILDRNNNITTHEQVLNAILTADKPSHIPSAIDRGHFPLGNARPLQLVKHYAMCGGWEFRYAPHQANVVSDLTDDDV